MIKLKSDGQQSNKTRNQYILLEWENLTGVCLSDMDNRDCVSVEMPDYKWGTLAKLANRFGLSVSAVTQVIKRHSRVIRQGKSSGVYRVR